MEVTGWLFNKQAAKNKEGWSAPRPPQLFNAFKPSLELILRRPLPAVIYSRYGAG